MGSSCIPGLWPGSCLGSWLGRFPLETERTIEKVMGGEEEIALGHAEFGVLNFGSHKAQEAWVPGENTSLEREKA